MLTPCLIKCRSVLIVTEVDFVICNKKVSCMGVNCEEMLMLLFLFWLCQQMSCVPSDQHIFPHISPPLSFFQFICPTFAFNSLKSEKVLGFDTVTEDLLWCATNDMFATKAPV